MKKIWPFSYYLLYFAANACFLPYMILYYQSLDFSGPQIGMLTAISPLITLVGAPFWTGIADASRRHKLVLSVTLLASIGCMLIYPFVTSLAAVLVLVLINSFMIAPVNSLADTATMTMLGSEQHMYGRIRVGGTIGWGLVAPLAGVVIGRYGLHWAFWSYSALMIVALLISQKFIFVHVNQAIDFRHGIRRLLSNRRLVLFLLTAFVCGMALMVINVYLFAYMEQLGISKSLMGLALTISTIAELAVFFLGNRLLAYLKPHGLLIMAMIAITVRLFLYAIFDSAPGILVFQLINGITFSAVWVAGVSYANENAPPGLSATAQGVFGAMVFGFGAAAGGYLGALLFEKVGGAQMYASFGAIMLAALIAYVILERRIPRASLPEPQLVLPSAE